MIKKVLKWIGIIFLIFIIIMVFFACLGLNETKNLKINDVDLSKLEDGKYVGSYDGYRWSNKVEVTIKDHKIESIVVLKSAMGDNTSIAEEVIKKVIEQQNLDVDTISGSTANTKSYLKSIENALNK